MNHRYRVSVVCDHCEEILDTQTLTDIDVIHGELVAELTVGISHACPDSMKDKPDAADTDDSGT